MPKRQATPPPGDDEPRYITICYPYPPQANLEILGDRLALVRWLACCMGQDDLYAIFHKPSAGNMVIAEIRRDHSGFRKLLGAHKWSEFVRSPGAHSAQITRIYFSTFSNGRAVEKAGWKRLFVMDDWFEGFSPRNKYITYPYPLSHYCEPPAETQNEYALCRPIPRDMFGFYVPTPSPVTVGSPNWIVSREDQQAVRGISSTSIITQLDDGLSYLNTPSPTASFHEPLFDPTFTTPSDGIAPGSNGNHSVKDYDPDLSDPEARNELSPTEDDDSNDCAWEDEFGSLSLQYTTNQDGTPLCPFHGGICKRGVCRDYHNLLKKIEREKERAPSAKWFRGGPKRESTFFPRTRGRGGPIGRGHYARGAAPTPKRGSIPGHSRKGSRGNGRGRAITVIST